jgi:hypothetical protein
MAHRVHVSVSSPALWDVRRCEDWLGHAALSDAEQACHAFVELLDELEGAPPVHALYLAILERLLEPILVAQAEQSKKFTARPLPLSHAESAAFTQSCDLWVALLRALRRLLRAEVKSPSPEHAVTLALLARRSIECTAEQIDAYLAARREVPEDLWHWLHEIYGLAQAHGVAEAQMLSAHARVPTGSNCTAAYVRPLLHALANPYGLSQRELAWTRRWTNQWSHKLKIGTAPRRSSAYAVDLDGGAPAQWTAAGGELQSRRFIDASELLRSIRRRIRKLAEGAAPVELGLGRDCSAPAASELLGLLLGAWGDAPRAGQFPRRASASPAGLVACFRDIHAAIAGRIAPEDPHPWEFSRRDAEHIHVFQRSLQTTTRELQQPAIELWETLEESATDFRLRRRGSGARIAHRQLIALRPHGARQYILCEVRWLAQAQDQSLAIGAKALPGLAHACEVRAPGGDVNRAVAFMQAFLLPLVTGHPQTIVLPVGWHQSERSIELRLQGELIKIRLGALLGRGYDFDRAEFQIEA